MKKHNEGYALVLVLVVITVLCLVAMAMTAASLKNLHNQQKSIERMEAKYAAQGELEKTIAGFEKKIKSQDGSLANIVLESGDSSNGGLCDESIEGVTVSVTYHTPNDIVANATESLGDAHDYLLVHLESVNSDVTVQCTIKITGSITLGVSGQYIVAQSGMKWEYVSYTITHNEGGGT